MPHWLFFFAAVLVISNVILNRGNDDQVVDMGDATLPRVSFMMGTEDKCVAWLCR